MEKKRLYCSNVKATKMMMNPKGHKRFSRCSTTWTLAFIELISLVKRLFELVSSMPGSKAFFVLLGSRGKHNVQTL